MSASDQNSAVFLTDTPAQIKNKIKKHAFSGGGDTAELHAKNGGNTDVDVAYQYLRFFFEDDDELERIRVEYSAGRMNSSTVKEKCVEVVTKIVVSVQEVF